MRKPFYITRPAVVVRRENTVYAVGRDFKKPLPVEHISDIYCHAPVTVKSGALFYLSKHGVPIHYFDKYGHYRGTFWPRERYLSGFVRIKQAEHYLDGKKRLRIAKEMVRGIIWNLKKVVRYYENRKEIRGRSGQLEELYGMVEKMESVSGLMGIESKAWEELYNAFPEMTGEEFEGRRRRPPRGKLNALLSFLNSQLYATTITEIYNTYLDPTISYLHEPLERRFSLALDIADIFKPLLSVRVALKLINRKVLSDADFEYLGDVTFLNKNGKRKVLREWDDTLHKTITHRKLRSKVTYRRLIRLELYKLVKHVIGDRPYESFKMWW